MSRAKQLALYDFKASHFIPRPLRDQGPAFGEQTSWRDANNNPITLPYYKFGWTLQHGWCRLDVSGVNGQIVFFSYSSGASLGLLDYPEVFGLSTNTLFVRPLPFHSKGPPYELLGNFSDH